MIRPPAMTGDEAARILTALVSRWPHPELDDAGLALELQGILDTGLTSQQAMTAIRHLLQASGQRFRPSASDLVDVVRPPRRPEWPALPPTPPLPVDEQRNQLAKVRAQLHARHRPASDAAPASAGEADEQAGAA